MNRRNFVRSAAILGTGTAIALTGHANGPGDRPAADDMVTLETQNAISNGLKYLADKQSSDGAYSVDRNGFGNVAITALSGLALLAGGYQPGRGKHGLAVSRCVDYLLAKGGTKGYLQNTTDQFLSHGAMYQHGFGALFLSEVCGTFPDAARQQKVRVMLGKAIALTVQSQNREGGWRYEPQPNNADVSVTVAQLMALRAAKNAGVFVDKSVVDKCVAYIKGCKMPDGGYCYQKGQPATGSLFPRSAAAVVGLFSAGVYEGEDHRKYVEPGLKYLMRYLPAGGGRAFDMRQDHYFYGHYYAALAMWTAGGNYWSDWFPAIRNELLARRNAAGVWDDFHGNAYATAMACIILQLPNNYLPIMQK